MVRTTSPGRTILRDGVGHVGDFSTNTGSVLPATRIARAERRPSGR